MLNKRLALSGAFTLSLLATVPAFAVTEVKLWHMEQPPQRVQRIQDLIDAFNAANPDIKVSQDPQSWGEVYAKVPAAMAAGNAPDILFAIPDFTTVIRKAGQLDSVADFVKELDGKHHFIPATVEPYSYDGGVWAVPLYNMSLNYWYHKKAFADAGVDVPKTWTEWKAATEKLSKDGVVGTGLPGNKQLYTDQTTYAIMVNNGASEIFNADGTLAFDNPKTVESYAFYKDLYKFTSPDAANWTWGEAEACFASDTCASILQFSVISTYDQQGGGDAADLGIAAVPHADGEADSATIAYSNAAIILSKDAAKRDAAKKFIAYLLEPETYGKFLTMEPGLFLPVTEDGAKATTFWSDPLVVKYKSQVEQMIANSHNGKLFGFTDGRVFPAIGPISAQNILAETLQKVVINGEDPAAAVKAGQARMVEATK
ncbi:ABC transporter substrate-binding protein [Kaistia algarum]|uniref:ABC transporter substrate-binding protein n=1 Tax=Kaistia algarum TaxID=2083279 RepID=UPI000CE8A2AB|nr:ABC transporter substrate-binding protein [Kaistia algarum]MCX5512725.1 ABC transporter substrate-binding protein [Kaistia algarum]PPE81767.1 ABC transporter substrate-binding protein [Kaistia algarum]